MPVTLIRDVRTIRSYRVVVIDREGSLLETSANLNLEKVKQLALNTVTEANELEALIMQEHHALIFRTYRDPTITS